MKYNFSKKKQLLAQHKSKEKTQNLKKKKENEKDCKFPPNQMAEERSKDKAIVKNMEQLKR